MRATGSVIFVFSAIVMGACVHAGRMPWVPTQDVGPRAPEPAIGRSHYVVVDPWDQGPRAAWIPLEPFGHGLVVHRRRIVVGNGEPRVSADQTTEPLVGASKLPARFGGGFLFWSAHSIYRADAFDSRLRPVTRVPESIDSISFAPKAIVVRSNGGDRWGLLPSGDRVPIEPHGLAAIEALDDGRALGVTDEGMVLASVDGGSHWTDVTVQIKSGLSQVRVIRDELWLVEANGTASRLEPDGHLAWFSEVPSDPPDARPIDPRWRASISPRRAVFRMGAAIDDATAIVLVEGDLVRVDVVTGAIVSILEGRFPPDARCEAVAVPGDVLFACLSHASKSAAGTAFVVSNTLSTAPAIEHTFPVASASFYASDDGGLAFSGPCRDATTTGAATVCVRTPGGRWEERNVAAVAVPGGSGSTANLDVVRWVPRADGHVVALVGGATPGIHDPSSGSFQPVVDEVRAAFEAPYVSPHGGGKGRFSSYRGYIGPSVVDATWSFGAGNTLRGWVAHGESVEVSEGGTLVRSPYAMVDVISSGAMALGRKEDRLYQSNDHGASWSEVATPSTGNEGIDLIGCTTAGCDLGVYFRVGWSFHPPHAEPPAVSVPVPAEIRRVRGLELSCRPAGEVVSKVLPRTGDSPEDLGLGMARLPVAKESTWAYVRNAIPRGMVSTSGESSGDADALQALRALFSGFATTHENDADVLTVAGPNKNVLGLRRGVSYVAPFDPSGRVVRNSIAMSDVVAAGRRAGMPIEELLHGEDFTESGAIVTLTSLDPSAVSDIAVHNADHGLLSIFRGDRVRVALSSFASQESSTVVSGVALPHDTTALLEVDSNGSHVFKVDGKGVTDLFDVGRFGSDSYSPANPDALAVGPNGDLAIVRTPSGKDPPSSLDPALLILPSAPPIPLASWSELKLADDPGCKAEKGGYRAVIQAQQPWIRVTTPGLQVEDEPMLARVRWTEKRVCLEGFEVKLPGVPGRPSNDSTRLSAQEPSVFGTWLVGKESTYARVGVGQGFEWRQELECTIVSTGP